LPFERHRRCRLEDEKEVEVLAGLVKGQMGLSRKNELGFGPGGEGEVGDRENLFLGQLRVVVDFWGQNEPPSRS
jgi:hypothetical protein